MPWVHPKRAVFRVLLYLARERGDLTWSGCLLTLLVKQ